MAGWVGAVGAGTTNGLIEAKRHLETEPLWCMKDVARFLNVSVKTVRRMEARGELHRCRHLIGVVRFSPRDVRRLASAR
jgi:hypothetical protein